MHRLLIALLLLFAIPCIALATPVPDTGQTTCYGCDFIGCDPPDLCCNWQEITCPNPGEDFYGQDAQYITNHHSYTKLDTNGNDLSDDATWPWAMVRDNVTGLIWEVKTDDGSIHDKDNAYTWERAMAFGTTLNSQSFGGYTDWRLPTIKELSCLADSSKPSGPTINTDYFPNTQPSLHWSSTVSIGNPDAAWCCSFGSSTVNAWGVSVERPAMAVRGDLSLNNFVDNLDGTITDTSTGLMWQQATAPGTYSWQQALSYCENLTIDEYDDWRVPNRNELQTLVDYNVSGPCINRDYFPNTTAFYYVSSTTAAYSPVFFWGVYFDAGVVSDYSKLTVSYPYLRCVRGGLCGPSGDTDGDTICNTADNCFEDYNPFQVDCDDDGEGDVCDGGTVDPDNDGVDVACDNCPNTPNPNQLDTYPPGGNNCGDACECEGNFDDDLDVDGTDAGSFKNDFGRSKIVDPCTNELPCNGDFDCDADVDGTNATQFKQDFGRSGLKNPCPSCPTDQWCVY